MRTLLLGLVLFGAVTVHSSEGRADDWHRRAGRGGSGFSISFGNGSDRFSASWGNAPSRLYRDHDFGYGYRQPSRSVYYAPYPVHSVPVYGPHYHSAPAYGDWHYHGRRSRCD
ncbi:MAG: hypothetical protein RLZZ458_2211 [Planctomycetota bacterium]